MIDGITFANEWFTEDFTLAELKTLRAKERLPDVRQRNTIYDGRYEVPTFQEVIELRDRLSRELHRKVGHHPGAQALDVLPLDRPAARGAVRADAASQPDRQPPRARSRCSRSRSRNLKPLDRQLPGVPLVQLFDAKTRKPGDVLAAGGTTTYGDMATPAGLRAVARYADIAGPSKDYIVPRDATGASLPPTTFVADAHAAGLDVVPYTFRNENQFLPLELRTGADPNAYGNAIAEYQQFFALGVDGLFSDNPDTAKAARDDE